MILYRIARCIYIDDLTGMGARLFGGRWNSEGQPALYLASSRSLSVLEVLVHLPPLIIPDDYCLVEIKVPDNSINNLSIDDLPENWKDISAPTILKRIGDEFLKEKKYLMMRVPSSIVPMEYNYILNPLHQDIKEVKILKKEPFSFDERLV